MSKNKILIIQTAFIGDVILATAIIESLVKYYGNEVEIDFLVRKGNESLLLNDPRIHKLYVWDKSKKWKDFFRIRKKINKRNYNKIICVQRFFMAGLFTFLAKSDYKVGFKKNPLSFIFTEKVEHLIGDGTHEIERNFKLLRSIPGITLEKPRLLPGSESHDRIKQYTSKPYVTISPTSVWFTKQLPAEKWEELINRLSQYQVYLLGGPGDKEHCEKIRDNLKDNSNVRVLAGELSLLDSAALMSKATMNYVNDSAPLHLCSAVNAPVTAVFCSTVPSFGFTPLSDRSFIVEYSKELSCRPCGLHGKRACPEGHFKCADIQVDLLLDTLN